MLLLHVTKQGYHGDEGLYETNESFFAFYQSETKCHSKISTKT